MPADETNSINSAMPQRQVFSQQVLLLAVLGMEIALFSISGTNFFQLENGFEVVRSSVEIGLLALALTPVIVTGGIDLSVGGARRTVCCDVRQAVARSEVSHRDRL